MRHKLTANTLMIAILSAALYCTVTETIFWPFAPYDMYSVTSRTAWTQYYLEGESLTGHRFSLSSGTYLYPFRNRELIFKVFPPLLKKDGSRMAELDQLLRMFKRHYMERLERGQHGGPPLATIRLYRVTWVPQEGATNLQNPTRKTLLREI